MDHHPVDYPGQAAPIHGPLPPRRDLWTYGDLAKFVLFSLAAEIGCVIAAYVVAFAIISVTGGSQRVDREPVEGMVLLSSTLAASLAGLGYMYYVVARKYRLPFWEALGFTPFQQRMYWFLLLGAVISVAEGLLDGLLAAPENTPIAEMLSGQGAFWVFGAFAIFIAPFFEEVLYRGFFYRPLEKSWGPIGAIAVTSVAFSAVHGPQYAFAWQYLLTLWLAGIWLGIARWRTGSLWPPILMHAGANVVSVVAFGLENGN